MKILKISFIAFILITGLIGCKANSIDHSTDPKVQGALEIERMLREGRKQAIKEGVELLKGNKDFIINANQAEICIYELEEPHIDKTEINEEIQAIFKGKFDKENDRRWLYSSKLPVGTKIYREIRNNSLYIYVEVSNEVDRIYRCKQFTGK